MEPSPLYQGHQFKPAQAPQARLSPEIPFGQQYVNNLGETTKSLQRIEDALIERNDSTILLQQEASEKQAALDLANELKYKLSLPDGAEGGIYDNYGRIRKDAVNNLRNKYIALSRNWHKGLINPEAAGKSAIATNEYTSGVSQTIEAALLANTKTRQKNAYLRNIEQNANLHEYDANDALIDEGLKQNAYSQVEADELKFDNNKARLAYTIDSTNDPDALQDMWYDPAMQEQLSYHPSLRNLLERKINLILDTQGRAANEEHFTTSKTAKGTGTAGASGKKAKALPPDGAPLYIQVLYAKFNGDFPENSEAAFEATQQYLSENVDETDETKTGLRQWNKAKLIANSIGLTDTAFNKAYAFRKRQLSPGGFDPEKMLSVIEDEHWLALTKDDEDRLTALLHKYTLEDNKNGKEYAVQQRPTREAARKKIQQEVAKNMRDRALREYNRWELQNEKAPIRDKYSKLLEITRKLETELEKKNISDFISGQLASAEANIERERMETTGRRRRTQKMESDTYAGVRHRPTDIYYKGVNLRDLAKYLYSDKETPIPTTSFNLQFNYKLAAPDSKLPDSKTHNIIYLPESTLLPNKKAHVYKRKGSLACTIEFRHSDKVQQPTPSRRLLASLGRATTPPTYIKWDGVDLDLGDALVDDYSAYYADNDILPPYNSDEVIHIDEHGHVHRPREEGPDDGLSDEHYTEEETYTDSDGKVYPPLPI